MKKVELIVTAPHIYTMKGEGVGYEEKKALVVDGSKIIDIVDIDKLSDQYEAEEQLDICLLYISTSGQQFIMIASHHCIPVS